MLDTCLSPSPIKYPTALITAKLRVKFNTLKQYTSGFFDLKKIDAARSIGFYEEQICRNNSYFCGTVNFSYVG